MSEIRLGNLGWKNNTAPVSPTNPWDTKDVNSDDIKGKLEQARVTCRRSYRGKARAS